MISDTVVIGAGPAGLAAAYELAGLGQSVLILEKDATVGGLSRTVEFKGFRCDIGGHRFFTKSPYVADLWRQVLGVEFLRRPRLSRIYYGGKFYSYPLKPANALSNLGWKASLLVVASFVAAKIRPRNPVVSFDDWVTNRFGRRLFQAFFKTYTEKVWGIDCRKLSADWAAQRIRNLSLGRALLDAFGVHRKGQVASLIDEFDYPRYGPGQMYERMAQLAVQRGARLLMGHRVTKVSHRDGAVTAVWTQDADGKTHEFGVARACFSSMPLDELMASLSPAAPADTLTAAASLHYRSLVTVNLMLDQPPTVPDTWIYIHDPAMRAGRVQFYNNWSSAMSPSPAQSVIGLEYFCTEGDSLWCMSDEDLRRQAQADLKAMNLMDPSKMFDSFVVKYAKAYPVYDEGYAQRLATIRQWLSSLRNLLPIGRYGQFRYNNMDHSILTAHCAVRSMLGEDFDPWSVNAEQEYCEERRDDEGSSAR